MCRVTSSSKQKPDTNRIKSSNENTDDDVFFILPPIDPPHLRLGFGLRSVVRARPNRTDGHGHGMGEMDTLRVRTDPPEQGYITTLYNRGLGLSETLVLGVTSGSFGEFDDRRTRGRHPFKSRTSYDMS